MVSCTVKQGASHRRYEKNESAIEVGFGLGRRLKPTLLKKRYEERERGLAKQIEVAGFWLGAQAGMPGLPERHRQVNLKIENLKFEVRGGFHPLRYSNIVKASPLKW